MAKRKRVRISFEQKLQWIVAMEGAALTIRAASTVLPEPNLIAALSLLEAGIFNLRPRPELEKDGQ